MTANSERPSGEKRRTVTIRPSGSGGIRSLASGRWVRASRTTGVPPPTAMREPSGLYRTWSSLRIASMITPAWPPTSARGAIVRRVRVSTKLTVPSLSANASVCPSGLRSRLISRSPSPRSTPMAAGLLSRAARRSLRVCSESSSVTPWRASSNERSRSSSASACAPRRCAAAVSASSRAFPRCSSATTQAITASTRSEATPASTAESRAAALLSPAILGMIVRIFFSTTDLVTLAGKLNAPLRSTRLRMRSGK